MSDNDDTIADNKYEIIGMCQSRCNTSITRRQDLLNVHDAGSSESRGGRQGQWIEIISIPFINLPRCSYLARTSLLAQWWSF